MNSKIKYSQALNFYWLSERALAPFGRHPINIQNVTTYLSV